MASQRIGSSRSGARCRPLDASSPLLAHVPAQAMGNCNSQRLAGGLSDKCGSTGAAKRRRRRLRRMKDGRRQSATTSTSSTTSSNSSSSAAQTNLANNSSNANAMKSGLNDQVRVIDLGTDLGDKETEKGDQLSGREDPPQQQQPETTTATTTTETTGLAKTDSSKPAKEVNDEQRNKTLEKLKGECCKAEICQLASWQAGRLALNWKLELKLMSKQLRALAPRVAAWPAVES